MNKSERFFNAMKQTTSVFKSHLESFHVGKEVEEIDSDTLNGVEAGLLWNAAVLRLSQSILRNYSYEMQINLAQQLAMKLATVLRREILEITTSTN